MPPRHPVAVLSLLVLSSHALAPRTRPEARAAFGLSDFWEAQQKSLPDFLPISFLEEQRQGLVTTLPWALEAAGELTGFTGFAETSVTTTELDEAAEKDAMDDVFAFALAASLVFESSGPGALAVAAATVVCEQPILDNPVAGVVCAAEAVSAANHKVALRTRVRMWCQSLNSVMPIFPNG